MKNMSTILDINSIAKRVSALENKSGGSVNPEDLYIYRDEYEYKDVVSSVCLLPQLSPAYHGDNIVSNGFHIENVYDLFDIGSEPVEVTNILYKWYGGIFYYEWFIILKNGIIETYSSVEAGASTDYADTPLETTPAINIELKTPIKIQNGDSLTVVCVPHNYFHEDGLYLKIKLDDYIGHDINWLNEKIQNYIGDESNDERIRVVIGSKTNIAFYSISHSTNNEYKKLKDVVITNDGTKSGKYEYVIKPISYQNTDPTGVPDMYLETYAVYIRYRTNAEKIKASAVFLSDEDTKILSSLLKAAKTELK